MRSVFLICLFFSLPAWCQYDIEDANKQDKKERSFSPFELKQRIYVGGEVGLSFGYGSGYFMLAPLIGYDITERFSAGISTMYQLRRFSNYQGNGININTFGMGVFSRYRPIDPVIFQVEFDMYNTVNFATGNSYDDRVNVPALMSGIGYAGGGSRSYYQIMVLYDFINDPNMPLPPLLFNQLHLKMGMVWYLG